MPEPLDSITRIATAAERIASVCERALPLLEGIFEELRDSRRRQALSSRGR